MIDYKNSIKYWDNRALLGSDLYSPNMSFVGFPSYGIYRHYFEALNLNKHMGLKQGASFLDLGGGTGRMGISFSKKIEKVTVVDFSKELLKIGEKFCKKNNINNVEFVQGDITEFETNIKYDVVFIGGVLMCLNDQEALHVLRLAKKALKKEGILIIRDSVAEKKTISKTSYAIYREKNSHKDLILKAGFSVQKEFISYNPSFSFYLHTHLRRNIKNKLVLQIFTMILSFILIFESLFVLIFRKIHLKMFFFLKRIKTPNVVYQKTLIAHHE